MQDFSNYPRQKTVVRSRMIILDRIAAVIVAAYSLTAFGSALILSPRFEYVPLLIIGLLPSVLLLVPQVWTMAAVTGMSLPCCVGATMYADVAQGLPSLPDKLLYDDSRFMLGIGAYALVRALQLGAPKIRAKNLKL